LLRIAAAIGSWGRGDLLGWLQERNGGEEEEGVLVRKQHEEERRGLTSGRGRRSCSCSPRKRGNLGRLRPWERAAGRGLSTPREEDEEEEKAAAAFPEAHFVRPFYLGGGLCLNCSYYYCCINDGIHRKRQRREMRWMGGLYTWRQLGPTRLTMAVRGVPRQP
jgi:hypothetical protein